VKILVIGCILEHIPFGWNQPNGMCPLKPASPVRAFPVRWNRARFHLTGNRSRRSIFRTLGISAFPHFRQTFVVPHRGWAGKVIFGLSDYRRPPALSFREAATRVLDWDAPL
jgi:hypothetical protein